MDDRAVSVSDVRAAAPPVTPAPGELGEAGEGGQGQGRAGEGQGRPPADD